MKNLSGNILHNPDHVLHCLLRPISTSLAQLFTQTTHVDDKVLPDRLLHLIDYDFII